MDLPWWVVPALKYAGYITVVFVLFLPVFNTFKMVLRMKSVGGGTRVEPFVASLLSYLCSLVLAGFDNSWSLVKMWDDESFWINLISTAVYGFYLYLFLRYADHTVRREWLPVAVSYAALMTMIGVLAEPAVPVRWLCMVAGVVVVVSSGTPHLLSWLVMDRYLENLPDWMSSAVGLVHYGVWMLREPDFFNLVQNGSGAVSSLAFLVMLYFWRNWRAPAAGDGGEERQPLLATAIANQEVVIQVPGPAAAGGSPAYPRLPEALTPQQDENNKQLPEAPTPQQDEKNKQLPEALTPQQAQDNQQLPEALTPQQDENNQELPEALTPQQDENNQELPEAKRASFPRTPKKKEAHKRYASF